QNLAAGAAGVRVTVRQEEHLVQVGRVHFAAALQAGVAGRAAARVGAGSVDPADGAALVAVSAGQQGAPHEFAVVLRAAELVTESDTVELVVFRQVADGRGGLGAHGRDARAVHRTRGVQHEGELTLHGLTVVGGRIFGRGRVGGRLDRRKVFTFAGRSRSRGSRRGRRRLGRRVGRGRRRRKLDVHTADWTVVSIGLVRVFAGQRRGPGGLGRDAGRAEDEGEA